MRLTPEQSAATPLYLLSALSLTIWLLYGVVSIYANVRGNLRGGGLPRPRRRGARSLNICLALQAALLAAYTWSRPSLQPKPGLQRLHEPAFALNTSGGVPLTLALAWPKGFCRYSLTRDKLHKCNSRYTALEHWTIHGLWSSGPAVQLADEAVCQSQFTRVANSIRDLPDIRKLWPASCHLLDYTWRNAYVTHGCAMARHRRVAGITDVFTYLGKAMQLYRFVDAAGKLARIGIEPKNNCHITYGELKRAFDGKQIGVVIREEQAPDGQQWLILSELHVCLSGPINPVIVDCPEVSTPDTLPLYLLAEHDSRIVSCRSDNAG